MESFWDSKPHAGVFRHLLLCLGNVVGKLLLGDLSLRNMMLENIKIERRCREMLSVVGLFDNIL